MEWYDGIEGYPEANCASLAICLDNGRMQLMRHESDDKAICIDTGIKPRKIKWNNNGTVREGSARPAVLACTPLLFMLALGVQLHVCSWAVLHLPTAIGVICALLVTKS